jgi:hypothetical protein
VPKLSNILRVPLTVAIALSALNCVTERTQRPIVTTPAPSIPEPPPEKQKSAARISNTDPCATQLHDVCGAFLLFYKQNQRLPHDLAELAKSPMFTDAAAELACPVSKRAYVYNPVGIMTTDRQPRVILYDAAPTHSGFRWAISIIEPEEEDGPLITKVIALPESTFTMKPPR